MKWKPDWEQAKANLTAWWEGKGFALSLSAPRREPIEDVPAPPPADLATRRSDPAWRVADAEYRMARTWFAAEAYPQLETLLGPGDLGSMLGATPHLAEDTVWYEPCLHDPERDESIRFEPEGNRWYEFHEALARAGRASANGRYIMAMPDLIENVDTLAALRGNEALLMDLIERPDWVHRRLAEINACYFAVFDRLYPLLEADGGNAFAAFAIWGPGKTAKLQCDFSCMISPAMYREFVLPYMQAQCEWLDYSLYHLDGTQAVQHLDTLLGLEALNGVQWTPQAGKPGGGSPQWYELYRRIRAGGKSVQAVGVQANEVVPLLDAVGPEGLFVKVRAGSMDEAEQLLERVEPYRTS